MKAGLHVLTEKLMGHSVHECKEMARVAEQTGLHLATGHQRHYNILYHEAMDTIQRGMLGDLHYIRAQWHRGNLPGSDSWQQPLPQEVKPERPAGRRSWSRKLESWKRQAGRSVGGREIDVWQKKVAQKEAQIADDACSRTTADELRLRGRAVHGRRTASESTTARPSRN